MITREQAQEAKKYFKKRYFRGKYRTYINAIGITRDEKRDYCLRIGLVEPLPEGMKLPRRCRGVRVLAEVIGEIKVR